MKVEDFQNKIASMQKHELELVERGEIPSEALPYGQRLTVEAYKKVLEEGGVHVYRFVNDTEAMRSGQIMTAHNSKRQPSGSRRWLAYRHRKSALAGHLLFLGCITEPRVKRS